METFLCLQVKRGKKCACGCACVASDTNTVHKATAANSCSLLMSMTMSLGMHFVFRAAWQRAPGSYLRWMMPRVWERRDSENLRALTGLVWSGLVLAVAVMSSMAGLGSSGDQKITATCQQPGFFHMLSGERAGQIA